MSSTERTVVLIDGANVYYSARRIELEIDWQRLLKHLQTQYHLLRAIYYTAVLQASGYTDLRPFLEEIAEIGYLVVTKPAKQRVDSDGDAVTTGDMDMEVAVDAIELTENPSVKQLVLFSGDGDFCPVIAALQQRGVFVIAISARETAADELRRQADQFIDLEDLREQIERID